MNQNQQMAAKVRLGQIALLTLVLALQVGLGVLAEGVTPCPATERESNSGMIADETLSEISGLVASRNQPGILWVHNDSGDAAVVYAIDLEGKLLASVQLLGSDGSMIDAVDCEDIALGPGPSDRDFLCLADIGDNAASRETVSIYCFPEPQIEIREGEPTVQIMAVCDVIEVAYPDGARDAETLLIDPITGDIVLISKDFIHGRAYRVPTDGDGIRTMEFLVELPWGFMTGGDISPDGLSILLRGYWNAEIWPRSAEGDWWMSLAALGCPAILAMEPQGEAIGFSADGLGYYTISEGAQPFLYSYRAVSEEITD